MNQKNQEEYAKSIAWRYSSIEGMIRQSLDRPIKKTKKKSPRKTLKNNNLQDKEKKD
jgi:hypothetical protein